MPHPAGRNLPLSLPRRFIGDLMHFAQQVPTVPVERRMRLGAVVDARRTAQPRPSWCAIFTKAYGLVAAAYPELRRAYLAFPRPHLYEHPISIASIAIERRFGDEDAVFPGHVISPERRSLRELDRKLRFFKEQPIERIGAFRRVLRLSSLPRPLRRLIWWGGLNVSGRKRAQYLGTFGISVYGSLGATSLHPLSPLTTVLNTGVLGADGSLDVRVVYDHRTLDGATVARALADLERVLNGEILNELRYLRTPNAA
ncbi:MAG TPA: hypothetical protein VNK04_23120 [Gemmataceae bacterium]|nr:hypothetical protein [Gemmataceae bacterium]